MAEDDEIPSGPSDLRLIHQRQNQFERNLNQVTENVKQVTLEMRDGFKNTNDGIAKLTTAISEGKAGPSLSVLLAGALGILTFGLSVLVVTAGTCWFVIEMRVTSSVMPVSMAQAKMEQTLDGAASTIARLADAQQNIKADLATNNAGDATSKDDRSHINSNLDRLTSLVTEFEARQVEHNATTRANEKEIETQFSAAASVQNIREKHQQQLNGIIWQQVYGWALPDGYAAFDISARDGNNIAK